MIPGLDLSEEAEERIWSAFGGWSSRFKAELAAGGVPYLIDRYRKLVESVETQSCSHGPDGTRKTGRAWQYCCGITYEFDADAQVRRALRVLEETAPPEVFSRFRPEIAAFDDRLYALYENPPARTGDWWEEGYPRGIIETGPHDLVDGWVRTPRTSQPGTPVEVLSLHADGTFTGRRARPGSVLDGQGTYAVAPGGRLEFTTGSGKTSVDYWLRIDELLLYFENGRVLRFFRREPAGTPEV